MRVLIGCESSGAVRRAFRALGHDAWSCDLLPADDGSKYHLQMDVFKAIDYHGPWDLAVFHPPCTFLCSSGLHWNLRRPGRALQTEASLKFVRRLLECGIPRIALENPIGCIGTRIRPADQMIHPWQFGEDASKATCLWLVNLPLLRPTKILPGGRKARRANQTPSGQNKLGPSTDRWKERSKTYTGIARAMAKQWGGA